MHLWPRVMELFCIANLLTIFLESSSAKLKTGAVNMDELVGNTEGFADSGYI